MPEQGVGARDILAPMKRRLLDIGEVAEYTGLSIHTLYTMVSQRRIPFVKVGRLTKFDLPLLDKWLMQHTVMPIRSSSGGVDVRIHK